MKINEYLDKEVGKPIYNHIKSGGRSAHYYDSLPVDGSLLRLFMYYITFVAPDNEKRDFRKYIESDNVLKHWVHFEYFNGRTIIRVGDDRKDGVGDNESVYNNTHVRNGIFRKLWAHCPANVFDNFLEYSRSKEALGKISSVSDFHGDRLVPSNVVLGVPEVAKPQWLIHLTPTLRNALEIAKNGFKRGLNTSQMDKMAYTYDVPSDEKENGQFSYAFSVEDINGGNINGDYPSKMFNKAMDAKVWNHAMHYAVMFKASGVRFNHYTDRENQVAFRNDSARDFIVLAYSRSNNEDEYDERNTRNAHYGIMWNVLTRNALNDKTSQNETELIKNNTIYQNSSLTDVVNWVVNNGGQYAKKIMRRKGDKIRENVSKILKEYLDKEVGKPIYDYIKSGGREDEIPFNSSLLKIFMYYINEVASDEIKNYAIKLLNNDAEFAKYLFTDSNEEFYNFVEEVYENEELREYIFNKLISSCGKNVEKDFLNYLNGKHGNAIRDISRSYYYPGALISDSFGEMLPPNVILGSPEVAKPQWMIHFTSRQSAADIVKDGFMYGLDTSRIKDIAFSKASDDYDNNITDGDFSYAYAINEIPNECSNDYFDAVMFKASGVRFNHYTDGENQIVFRNDSARDFVTLAYDYEDKVWCVISKKYSQSPMFFLNYDVVSKNCRVYQHKNLQNVVNWVANNGDQYANLIMNRKGDKIRESTKKIHITERQENLLVNESIKVHKGEKGKECSTQGKWADSINCPHCGEKAFFSMSLSDGDKGRGRIKVHDENGKEIDSEVQTIALYYCPNCYRFTAHNNMA